MTFEQLCLDAYVDVSLPRRLALLVEVTRGANCSRYVLVCFPALLALGAQSWRNRWKLASTLERTVPAPRRATVLPDRGQEEVQ